MLLLTIGRFDRATRKLLSAFRFLLTWIERTPSWLACRRVSLITLWLPCAMPTASQGCCLDDGGSPRSWKTPVQVGVRVCSQMTREHSCLIFRILFSTDEMPNRLGVHTLENSFPEESVFPVERVPVPRIESLLTDHLKSNHEMWVAKVKEEERLKEERAEWVWMFWPFS